MTDPQPFETEERLPIVFDLDGTLAENTYPEPHIGKVIVDMANLARRYHNLGNREIVIHTARPESHKEAIQRWVRLNGLETIIYDIVCGKPRAALYVDDRAYNPWGERQGGDSDVSGQGRDSSEAPAAPSTTRWLETKHGFVPVWIEGTYEYDPSEQDELLAIFTDLLRGPTGDGGTKRARGDKVSWRFDPGHEKAFFSHISKWKKGELVDPDSGSHPMVHAAWRALAIAVQESPEGRKELAAYHQRQIDAMFNDLYAQQMRAIWGCAGGGHLHSPS